MFGRLPVTTARLQPSDLATSNNTIKSEPIGLSLFEKQTCARVDLSHSGNQVGETCQCHQDIQGKEIRDSDSFPYRTEDAADLKITITLDILTNAPHDEVTH